MFALLYSLGVSCLFGESSPIINSAPKVGLLTFLTRTPIQIASVSARYQPFSSTCESLKILKSLLRRLLGLNLPDRFGSTSWQPQPARRASASNRRAAPRSNLRNRHTLFVRRRLRRRAHTLAFRCQPSKLLGSPGHSIRALTPMSNTNRTHSSRNSRSRRSNIPTIDPLPQQSAAAGQLPSYHASQTATPGPETDLRSQFDVGSHHSTHAHSSHHSRHSSRHAYSAHPSRNSSRHAHASLHSRAPSPLPPLPAPMPWAQPRERNANIRRLGDDERVSRGLWFFAGGTGRPPTGAQLREWKRREREKRGSGHGFWNRIARYLFEPVREPPAQPLRFDSPRNPNGGPVPGQPGWGQREQGQE